MMTRRILASVVTALLAIAAFLVVGAPANATTPPPPPSMWPSWDYDYGTVTSTHTFVFTNTLVNPMVGGNPLGFHYSTAFHLTQNTCTTRVNPGSTCNVTVSFTAVPALGPLVDALQLQFTDLTGHPIATPSVTLFAQNAEYVTTDYSTGYVMFPDTHVGTRPALASQPADYSLLILLFHLHGPWPPWDLPPPDHAPWSVLGNTCVQVTGTTCQVTIGFQPTAIGTFTTSFHMSFENPQNGASVTVQNLTLIGRGI